MHTVKQPLTTLRFVGRRFEDAGLEIGVLPELVAYKELLVKTSEELWRHRHPGRERLPPRYRESIVVKFYGLQSGSTTVPLLREVEFVGDELPFVRDDEVDEAASLIEAAIEAAAADFALPEEFPKPAIPLFAEFGRRLEADEAICARARKRDHEVRYTPMVRDRLATWLQTTYEDMVDFVGEVRLADLDASNFAIRRDDGQVVRGKFDPAQEELITEALREHATRRLRIKGLAEFSHQTRGLRRIVRVDHARPLKVGEEEFDPTARPIWEIVAEIGAEVPPEEWAKVPRDLAKNLDHYLYGSPKTEE